MPFLYTITFRSDTTANALQFLKLQLVADDQMHALKLSTEKAIELQMEVMRVEQVEAVADQYTSGYVLSIGGKEVSV